MGKTSYIGSSATRRTGPPSIIARQAFPQSFLAIRIAIMFPPRVSLACSTNIPPDYITERRQAELLLLGRAIHPFRRRPLRDHHVRILNSRIAVAAVCQRVFQVLLIVAPREIGALM